MGTILFIVLRLAGLLNTPNDWLWLCVLVSLYTIGIPSLIKMVRK